MHDTTTEHHGKSGYDHRKQLEGQYNASFAVRQQIFSFLPIMSRALCDLTANETVSQESSPRETS
jgi:hypothetical protein